MNSTNSQKSSSQGFGSMVLNDPQKQREIASKGGKAAHLSGKAFEWDSQSAKEAGRKGGKSTKTYNTDTEADIEE